mmetsp:Transcript_17103/g.40476  ORF Transcript_17103/g.40476 Transcript_17103/m.40476 type:complete len:318 (-) Transcript_17103:1271-2224(-)
MLLAQPVRMHAIHRVIGPNDQPLVHSLAGILRHLHDDLFGLAHCLHAYPFGNLLDGHIRLDRLSGKVFRHHQLVGHDVVREPGSTHNSGTGALGDAGRQDNPRGAVLDVHEQVVEVHTEEEKAQRAQESVHETQQELQEAHGLLGSRWATAGAGIASVVVLRRKLWQRFQAPQEVPVFAQLPEDVGHRIRAKENPHAAHAPGLCPGRRFGSTAEVLGTAGVLRLVVVLGVAVAPRLDGGLEEDEVHDPHRHGGRDGVQVHLARDQVCDRLDGCQARSHRGGGIVGGQVEHALDGAEVDQSHRREKHDQRAHALQQLG